MIEFVFHERKAAQAAARLLRRHGGEMEYFKLIKLMYLADRRVLIETGLPITGDRMVSMDHGPVLSGVYDLIKGEWAGDGSWNTYVNPRTGHSVSWTGRKDESELSEGERGVLDEVHAEFGGRHWWRLRDETHKLREWHDPGKSSLPIDPGEILKSAGISDLDLEIVTAEVAEIAAFKKKYTA